MGKVVNVNKNVEIKSISLKSCLFYFHVGLHCLLREGS